MTETDVQARARILTDVTHERHAQDDKWGGPEHDDTHTAKDWVSYIVEHANRVLEYTGQPAAHERKQFVRVAALAIAAVEACDRRDAVGTGRVPPKGPSFVASPPVAAQPVLTPMLLLCPGCGRRHIDTGPWAKKPHHTHACQHCGMVWRPAIIATVGVEFLPGFRNLPEHLITRTVILCAACGKAVGGIAYERARKEGYFHPECGE